MIKNYLKIAFRNIAQNKVFSFISIMGLSIGIAICLLILQYVNFKLSYDTFHEHADQIYRVKHESYKNGVSDASALTFASVGPALARDFPEVKETTGFSSLECTASTTGSDGQVTAFSEKSVYFVDSSFFEVFSFPIVRGSATAMNEPNAIIITEQAAQKYFGKDDPIGKTIRLENHNQGLLLDATIKGVCRNVPTNSHLQFNFLISSTREENAWSYPDIYTYVLLTKEAKPGTLESKLPAFLEKYTGQQQEGMDTKVVFSLQSLTSIHLYSTLKGELSATGGGKLIWILAFSALLILLIAYINYINLSTAKSMERAKEVGIRKTLGSERIQLTQQFFLEAIVYNLISILFALVIVLVSFRWFVQLSGLSDDFTLFNSPWHWLGFLVFFVAGAILSGLYPALVLSSYQPIQVLKGKILGTNKGITLRKVLVVFQFSVSIILMIGAFTVYHQVNYMRTKDLGIDMHNTMVIAAPESRRETQQEEDAYYQNCSAFKNEVARYAGISGVTFASSVPGEELTWVRPYKRKNEQSGLKDEVLYANFSIGPEFIDQLKVSMIAGEKFSLDKAASLYKATSHIPVMINEAAVEAMGFENSKSAIGQILTDKNKKGRIFEYEIIGVTSNFHQNSLKSAFTPIVFHLEDGSGMKYFVIKVDASRTNDVVKQIESSYKWLFEGTPFQYFFLDEFFDQQYLAEQQFGSVFGLFTGFAIFVACLGLIGLMLFSIAQRNKEIGIRKVLGASSASLFLLLSEDFIQLILLATLIALPISIWGVQRWLQNYAFHIGIDTWLYLVPSLFILVVALLSVSVLIMKAATTNPIKALRNE